MRNLLGSLTFALAVSGAQADPYNQAGPAVIHIHVHGIYKQAIKGKIDYENTGSGFVVSPDGLIMSAGHLAPDPALFIPGELYIDGRFPRKVNQAMVAQDPVVQLEIIRASTIPHDVALFRIKELDKPLPYLRLCDEYTVNEHLVVLGYTGGLPALSITTGNVKTPAIDPGPLVMQMPLSKGDSGGPVFNQGGGVFGIAVGGQTVNSERIESTTLAVLLSNAIADMEPETRALLGVSYDPDCSKTLGDAVAARTVRQMQTQVRSFAISRTLDTHSFSVTRQPFTEVIPVPDGFRFLEVLGINVASLNHSPSNGAQVTIEPGGNALEVRYTLESGPFYDQWRGWIDAFVMAKLQPRSAELR